MQYNNLGVVKQTNIQVMMMAKIEREFEE